MSLRNTYFPQLPWSCKIEILAFLTLREIWLLGNSNKGAFVTFLRERDARIGESLSSARYLPHGHSVDRTCLVSYPRSGNSYLRRILEEATGIVTGSDSRPYRTLTSSLLRCGFKGEGIYDGSVLVVKSHFPERMGYIKFNAKKIILLVRNPFDSIESYFHMGLTNTHDKSLSDEAKQTLNSVWEEFIVNEVQVWCDFHDYWLNQAKNGVSMLLVRFEDLLINREDCIVSLNEFLDLNYTSDNKVFLYRHYIAKKFLIEFNKFKATSPGYAPRRQINLNGSKNNLSDRYHLKNIKYISKKCQEFMLIFGYDVIQDDLGYHILKIKPLNHSEIVKDKPNLFICGGAPAESKCTKIVRATTNSNPVVINSEFSVRKQSDKFGREISVLRKQFTDDDKNPFKCK